MAECSYFDIIQILAEEEKVMAKANLTFYNMEGLEYGVIKLGTRDAHSKGQKSGGGDSENVLGKRPFNLNDLQKDTCVEVPLWMAISLSEKRFASIQLPKVFSKSFK